MIYPQVTLSFILCFPPIACRKTMSGREAPRTKEYQQWVSLLSSVAAWLSQIQSILAGLGMSVLRIVTITGGKMEMHLWFCHFGNHGDEDLQSTLVTLLRNLGEVLFVVKLDAYHEAALGVSTLRCRARIPYQIGYLLFSPYFSKSISSYLKHR